MDLLLHLGHMKTGTTYLQNTFAANRAALAARGIHYPDSGEMAGKDPVLEVSGGNARHLLDGDEPLPRALRRHAEAGGGADCLLSSEALFYDLADLVQPADLVAAAQAAGFGRVRMLLFIRDPVATARSRWQQQIKLGETVDAADYFARSAEPAQAARLFDRLEGVAAAKLTVRNYSRVSGHLVEIAEAWLGLPPEALDRLPATRVNRSLSAGELALKRALNRTVPDAGLLIPEINRRLSDMRVDEPVPETAVQQALLDRLAPSMAQVNARLPEAEHYRPDLHAPSPLSGPYSFTDAQIETIADSLGGEIAMLRGRLAAMRSDPASALPLRALARGLATRLLRGRGGA